MNRRYLLRALGLSGIAALVSGRTVKAVSPEIEPDHECGPGCYESAESVARAIIADTDAWKRKLHDWSKRVMVVTRCGQVGCEITLRGNAWQYTQRPLTHQERTSFRVEYGRSSDLILCFRRDDAFLFRGFILNGRQDGWNLSVEAA